MAKEPRTTKSAATDAAPGDTPRNATEPAGAPKSVGAPAKAAAKKRAGKKRGKGATERGKKSGPSRSTGQPYARARESSDPWSENRDAAKAALLAHMATTGDTISEACRVLEIPRSTLYDWRKADPSFSERLRDAYSAGADVLEQEAIRRAVKGWREPVFHMGKRVGAVKKRSDSLLQFLIQRHDRIKLDRDERPPTDAGMVSLDIAKMPAELRAQIRAELERQKRAAANVARST